MQLSKRRKYTIAVVFLNFKCKVTFSGFPHGVIVVDGSGEH